MDFKIISDAYLCYFTFFYLFLLLDIHSTEYEICKHFLLNFNESLTRQIDFRTVNYN
jgi:hypothetical protein